MVVDDATRVRNLVASLPEASWHEDDGARDFESDVTTESSDDYDDEAVALEYAKIISEQDEDPAYRTSKLLYVEGLAATTAKDVIFSYFSKYGIVRSVEINAVESGRPRSAWVCFAVKPFSPKFCESVVLDGVPVDATFWFDDGHVDEDASVSADEANAQLVCGPTGLSIGTMLNSKQFLEGWRVENDSLCFKMDTAHCMFVIEFDVADDDKNDMATTRYRIDFFWTTLLHEIDVERDLGMQQLPVAHLTFVLRHAPRYWKQAWSSSEEETTPSPFWQRITFIDRPVDPTVSLDVAVGAPDLGLWTDLRVSFMPTGDAAHDASFEQFTRVAMQFGLMGLQDEAHSRKGPRVEVVHLVEEYGVHHHASLYQLPFVVWYSLEAAISHRCFNKYTLNTAFYTALGALALDPPDLCAMLNHVVVSHAHYKHQTTRFVPSNDESSRMEDEHPMALLRAAWNHVKGTMTTVSVTIDDENDGFYLVHSVLVTPTSLVVELPRLEQVNRVMRAFPHHADRFLRVRFVEENWQPLDPVTVTRYKMAFHQDGVPNRVFQVLTHGLRVAGRHYEFLAFDTAGLDSHTCWFFAIGQDCSAKIIRDALIGDSFNQLGSLSDYVTAMDALLASHLPIGLETNHTSLGTINDNNSDTNAMPFTPTSTSSPSKSSSNTNNNNYTTKGGKKKGKKQKQQRKTLSLAELNDALENPQQIVNPLTLPAKGAPWMPPFISWLDTYLGYSDLEWPTSGKMALSLSTDVQKTLAMDRPPSAMLVSVRGTVGVVGRSTFVDGKRVKVQFRPWQYHFSPPNDFMGLINQLQVHAVSSYEPAVLDWSLIAVLSTITIANHHFLSKVQQNVAVLQSMVRNPTIAVEYLKTFSNGHGTVQSMRRMVDAGFLTRGDRFLIDRLTAFQYHWTLGMKFRGAIPIPKGASLMVIMDDTNTLAENQVFCQISDLKLGLRSKTQILKGPVLVARHKPTMHSGDIRVLDAVDAPQLRQWHDVIVVSGRQNTPVPRLHANGRIDGQRFMIIWDPHLLPSNYNTNPINDRSATSSMSQPMTASRAAKLFVHHVNNDHRRFMMDQFLTNADQAKGGTSDGRCVQLALQQSDVENFAHCPCEVTMDPKEELIDYPNFLFKRESRVYRSRNVSGLIANLIPNMPYDNYYGPTVSGAMPYDPRLKLAGMAPYVYRARGIKAAYDAQVDALMTQYGICTEAELISGFVICQRQYQQQIPFQPHGHTDPLFLPDDLHAHMMRAVTALRLKYRRIFDDEFDADRRANTTKDGADASSEPPTSWNAAKRVEKERKAAAWYYVTYHPSEIQHTMRGGSNRKRFLSFPWVVDEILCEIAVRQHNASDVSALDPVLIGENDKATADDDDDVHVVQSSRSTKPRRRNRPSTDTQQDVAPIPIINIKLSDITRGARTS
ncbi:RNA dependent RNA polymerase-domain-containing protein [Gongronella butleri]|nr:RNA dependent RNA polymerase-domain-containing protein [Gongronella butleri]